MCTLGSHRAGQWRRKESNLRKKQIQYEKEGGGDQGRQMETETDREGKIDR